MPEKRILPGLENAARNAFNARTADFLGKPVFDLTFSAGQKVTYGPPGDRSDYDVPDGLSFEFYPHFQVQEDASILRSREDYERIFSASIRVPATGISFGGSVQSEIVFHGSLFQEAECVYTLNFVMQMVYLVQRDEIFSLTGEFKDALDSLPPDLADKGDLESYHRFFDAFGTHYLKNGVFGGFITLETAIAESLLENIGEKRFRSQVKESLGNILDKGFLDTAAAYNGRELLREYRDEISFSLYTSGGYANGLTDAYLKSVFLRPILLFSTPPGYQKTQLGILSELADDPAKKAAINEAVKLYILRRDLGNGLFGSPGGKDFSIPIKAKADGFVIGNCTGIKCDDGGLVGKTDHTDNPARIRSGAFVSHEAPHIPYASMTMPVRSDDRYCVTREDLFDALTADLNFFPIVGPREPVFGEWQSIDFMGETRVAESDGLAVCEILCNYISPKNKFSGGFVLGKQSLPGNHSGDFTTVAAGSALQSNISRKIKGVLIESFCMPVPRNTSYRLDFQAFDGLAENPSVTADWIPIQSPFRLLHGFQTRMVGRIYYALTDGFLVGTLSASREGEKNRGTLALFSNPHRHWLGKGPPLARVSVFVQHLDFGPFPVPCNSFMVPIKKNNYYRVVTDDVQGAVSAVLSWFPFGIDQKFRKDL